MTLWYKWSLDHLDRDAESTATIHVPVDSPWFDGHFPGTPVLPGIAQLAMVHDMLVQMYAHKVAVKRITRVRFKQIIRPGQTLHLTMSRGHRRGSHNFRIAGEDGLICSGQLKLRTKQGELKTMTVETDAVILRVAEIMINELKLEDVTPETFDPDIDLVDEVGIDSMDLATVALVLRDEYTVRIDEDDYPKLTTVRLIGEYIQKKLAA